MRKRSILSFLFSSIVAVGGFVGSDARADSSGWSGVYFGGSIGGTSSEFDNMEFAKVFPDAVGTNSVTNLSGGLSSVETYTGTPDTLEVPDSSSFSGGIHGGYNYQTGNLVFGVEADVTFLNGGDTKNFSYAETSTIELRRNNMVVARAIDTLSATGNVKVSFDQITSLRGRLGYATESLLLYATGGAAWVDAEVAATLTGTSGGFSVTLTSKRKTRENGYVVGGGAEMKLTSKISGRVEALHYGFGDDVDMTTVRGGISYHLN